MITCPRCGRQLADGVKFCGGCGTPVGGIPAGGSPVGGMPENGNMAGGVPAGGIPAGMPGVRPAQKPEKKGNKNLFLFGGIGVAALCVIILVVVLVFFLRGRGTDGADYVFFVKDGELFFADLSDPEPWQISSGLTVGNADNRDLAYYVDYISMNCRVSGNGKTIFYPERYDADSREFSLYCRSASRQEEEPVRIDTGVYLYVANKAGTLVTYEKNDVLYQYDVKTGEKIKIGEGWYTSLEDVVSEDGRVWYENEDSLYCWQQGESEKVDSGDIDIHYISENKDWILYGKDGALYRKEYGEEKQRIAFAYDGCEAYETGEIYYIVEESKVTLMDFVEDDMGTGVENPYVTRQWLSENEVAGRYSLYYYDGEESKKVVDAGIMEFSEGSYAYPALAFRQFDDSAVKKTKLSEIRDGSAFYQEVRDVLSKSDDVTLCIVREDQVTEIGRGLAVYSFRFDTEGKIACFTESAENSDSWVGDLYKIDFSGNTAGKPELLDQDVYLYRCEINEAGQIVYLKDFDSDTYKGDLYIDGNLVDYEVSDYIYYPDLKKTFYYADNMLKAYAGGEAEVIGEVAENYRSYSLLADGGAVCFYDYNSDYYRGDLGVYWNGSLEVIDEDVYRYMVAGNAVLYLRDYSRDYFRGDLYFYRDGKVEKLEEDVLTMYYIAE